MKRFKFDKKAAKPILIEASFYTKDKATMYKGDFVLDTGTKGIILSKDIATYLGIDLGKAKKGVVKNSTDTQSSYVVQLDSIETLGNTKNSIVVSFIDLNKNLNILGVIGRTFLLDKILEIDYKKGEIELTT